MSYHAHTLDLDELEEIPYAYIAGPMSGIEDYNFPKFNEVADKLIQAGYIVENPAETDISDEFPDYFEVHNEDDWTVESSAYQLYLKKSFRKLLSCNHLVLLEGWQDSRGARCELEIAKALNFVILTEQDI